MGDDYEEVVYWTEQHFLPLEEKDCTECRASKTECKYCRGTGRREVQLLLIDWPKTEKSLLAESSNKRYDLMLKAGAFVETQTGTKQLFINSSEQQQVSIMLAYLEGSWPPPELRTVRRRQDGRRWR